MEKYIYRAKLDRVVDGDTIDALIDVGFDIWFKKRIRFKGLEPWGDNIYCDSNLRQHYITIEQPNTIMDLHKRVLPFNNEKNNEILVTINERFNQQDFDYIRQLSEILANDNELYEEELPCEFELGNLKIEIFQLNTYEKDLIICEK